MPRGCVPKVEGVHKVTVLAQLEVSQGKVLQEVALPLPTLTGAAAIRNV